MYKQSQIEELSLAITPFLFPEAYQKDTPPKVRAEDIAVHLINKGYVKLADLARMKTMKLLSDEEIQKAFNDAFDKSAYFDHKPTQEDVLLVRLRAVAQTQLERDKKNES